MQIRPLDVLDLPQLLRHLDRHLAESGTPGTPLFGPFPPRTSPNWSNGPKRVDFETSMATPLTETGWCRAWGLTTSDSIVGHVMLHGEKLAAARHRASVGIGIEFEFRGSGRGTRLLETALNYARDHTGLLWIDLNVFAHNHAAIAVYSKLGFENVAVTRDRFRIDDRSIDNLQMTLAIRRG